MSPAGPSCCRWPPGTRGIFQECKELSKFKFGAEGCSLWGAGRGLLKGRTVCGPLEKPELDLGTGPGTHMPVAPPVTFLSVAAKSSQVHLLQPQGALRLQPEGSHSLVRRPRPSEANTEEESPVGRRGPGRKSARPTACLPFLTSTWLQEWDIEITLHAGLGKRLVWSRDRFGAIRPNPCCVYSAKTAQCWVHQLLPRPRGSATREEGAEAFL